jgi:hypothetical protein
MSARIIESRKRRGILCSFDAMFLASFRLVKSAPLMLNRNDSRRGQPFIYGSKGKDADRYRANQSQCASCCLDPAYRLKIRDAVEEERLMKNHGDSKDCLEAKSAVDR